MLFQTSIQMTTRIAKQSFPVVVFSLSVYCAIISIKSMSCAHYNPAAKTSVLFEKYCLNGYWKENDEGGLPKIIFISAGN